MFVYLITNKINGKRYVGQTIKTVGVRFARHCWACTLKRCSMPITMAIKKYGKENFSVEVLHECSSIEELNHMEKHYADALNTFSPSGYNLKAGNGNGAMSQETKDKIGKAHRGRKASDETKAKLSISHKGMRVSEATKLKLSELNKGKPGSEYCYQRAREHNIKSYELYAPDGTLTKITNMKEFCAANKLHASNMSMVVNGRKLHYKGWTLDPDLHKTASTSDRYYHYKRK